MDEIGTLGELDGHVGTDWSPRVLVAAHCLARDRAPGVSPSSLVYRRMVANGLEAAQATLSAIRTVAPPAWRRLSPRSRAAIAVRVALPAMNAYLRTEGF